MKKNSTTKPIAEQEQPALGALFTDGIRDLYWAEQHLLKALPKMIRAASSKELGSAISDHLKETQTHVARLEQIFGLLGTAIRAKKCDAMEGLSKEGELTIETTPEGSAARDVGIILSSQKVEHYEIASYSGLQQLAITLGLEEIAALLGQTLEEEKNAEAKLATIAADGINDRALKEG